MKISLFALCLFLITNIYANNDKDRLEFVNNELNNIKERIKQGQDASLFQSYVDKYKAEKKELEARIKESEKKKEKPKPKPKKVAKKTKTKSSAVLPTIWIQEKDLDKRAAEIDRKLASERKNYLSLAARGITGRALEQAKINITALELEKEKLNNNKGTTQQVDKMFSYKGHFQFRTESAKYQKGAASVERQSEQSLARLRTYFTFTPNNKLKFNFTPQATNIFGGQNISGNNTSGSTNRNELYVFEANINYSLFQNLDLKLGKQEISYGDHLFIGALPWANAGRSFDALKAKYKYASGWTDFFYSKITNNSTAVKATDDKDLFMVYNSFNYTNFLNPLDLYILHQEDASSDPEQELNLIGFRLKGSSGMFFYRTENGIQSGRNMADDAYQYNLEAGVSFLKSKVSMEYSVAGPGYIQLYPTAHKFLGFADVVGRRNVKHFAFHVKSNILPWLFVRADYHNFKRQDTTKSAYKLLGSAWGTSGDSDDIGSEVDVVFVFKTKDNLKFQLGGAWFNPGTYLTAQTGNNGETTRFIYGQVNAGF